MASRRRSTRAQTCVEENNQPVICASEPLNSKGLPIIPAELLLEILSYMQGVPIPCFVPQVLNANYLERCKALRGLSQLCRSLRSALLPLVWERIEVCAIDTHKDLSNVFSADRWCKALATDLVEQLEIVTIREPSYAAYVKIVNVMITSYCVDRVLPELSRCLALMPNLHTVQIMELLDRQSFSYTCRYPYASEQSLFKSAFERYTFPSVQRVFLPLRAYGLFSCFPNALWVVLNQGLPRVRYVWEPYCSFKNFETYVTEAAKHCHKVQKFYWPDEPRCGSNYRECTFSIFHGLRVVRLYAEYDTVKLFNQLSMLKNLEEIELIAAKDTERLQQLKQAAMTTLERVSVDPKQKRLVVHCGRKVEVIKFTEDG